MRYLLEVEPFWAAAWMSPSLEDMNTESQQPPEKWGEGSRVDQS